MARLGRVFWVAVVVCGVGMGLLLKWLNFRGGKSTLSLHNLDVKREEASRHFDRASNTDAAALHRSRSSELQMRSRSSTGLEHELDHP